MSQQNTLVCRKLTGINTESIRTMIGSDTLESRCVKLDLGGDTIVEAAVVLGRRTALDRGTDRLTGRPATAEPEWFAVESRPSPVRQARDDTARRAAAQPIAAIASVGGATAVRRIAVNGRRGVRYDRDDPASDRLAYRCRTDPAARRERRRRRR